MGKLLVVENSPRYDMNPLREYGEPTFLLMRPVDPMTPAESCHLFSRRLEQLDYDPVSDAIVMTGYSLLLVYLMSVVTAEYEGPYRVLLFDAKQNRYRESVIDPEVYSAK